jgi:hypothetical protein
MTRLFALVTASLAGLAVTILPNHQYWTSFGYVGFGGLTVSCTPATVAGGSDRCYWVPRLDAVLTLSFLAQGVIAAVLTFLAVAALRVAWRSFDEQRSG